MNEKKVCIVGLGGVGGYVGCMLSENVGNLYFLARGKRLKSIIEKGLILQSDAHGEIIAHPKMATDNAEDIGIMDYIFICVKNFSLEQVCNQIKPMIDENTIIIPLMNGVGVSDKIRDLIPNCKVIDSLVYVTSGSDDNFVIHHSSGYCNIHIGYAGNDNLNKNILLYIQNILQASKITCTIEDDIDAAIWKKYILNCAYNIITAYYNATTLDIRNNETALTQFKALLSEACSVARKLNINISNDLEEIHFNHLLKNQSDSSTSSLKRDIEAGRQNELEIFSGRLLELGSKCGIELPMTKFFYNELKDR